MATRSSGLPATKKTLSAKETRMATRRNVPTAKANQLATMSGRLFKQRNLSAIGRKKNYEREPSSKKSYFVP
jgi:hypothetical protein